MIQNLIFKQDEIPEEEVNQIESNALSFLNKQLKTYSKVEIEGMLAGDIGSGMLFLSLVDSLDPRVKQKISKSTKQATFTVRELGIARINYPYDFKIILEGMEYCTGFFLHIQEQKLCVVGHLPIDEANVVDVVDNTLCPLFKFLIHREGINLKNSTLMLCCGDDMNNPERSKHQGDPLPGQLAYLRIRQLCCGMFKQITLNKKCIVKPSDAVIFSSKHNSLDVEKNDAPSPKF